VGVGRDFAASGEHHQASIRTARQPARNTTRPDGAISLRAASSRPASRRSAWSSSRWPSPAP